MKLSLTLALLLASAIPGRADLFTIFAPNPATTIMTVGDTLSVDVELFSTQPVFTYGFDLNYPTFLSFISASETGFFATNGSGLNYDPPDDADGIVTTVFDTISGPDSYPVGVVGNVVNFQFLVNAAGTGNLSLANPFAGDAYFDPFDVTDQSLDPVSITAADAPVSTPEPSMMVPLAFLAVAFLCWKSRFNGAAADR